MMTTYTCGECGASYPDEGLARAHMLEAHGAAEVVEQGRLVEKDGRLTLTNNDTGIRLDMTKLLADMRAGTVGDQAQYQTAAPAPTQKSKGKGKRARARR